MKRIFSAALIAFAALTATATASASPYIKVHLTEQFQSGATFDGILTFSDDFVGLYIVNGTLSGGGYGVNPITWSWHINITGTGQGSDSNNDASTFEDWLMSGPVQGSYPSLHTPFIGISWAPATDGVLRLTLNSDPLHTGITGVNGNDLAVSYTVTAVPEPETYAMLLTGLGLVGVIARRRQKQA